jgi:tetratricopeptide (TPR) repeat protein
MLTRTLLGTCFYLAVSYACAEDISLCRSGWAATQGGDHAGAIALFEECIKKGDLTKASLARTYRNIGIAYRRGKEPLKAVDAYNKAIALEPVDVWDDYINQGNAYDEAGDIKAALASYQKALEIKPDYGEAFYNRGVAYEGQKMLAEAKADFQRAYDAGLRTRLLAERMQVHGMLPEAGSP